MQPLFGRARVRVAGQNVEEVNVAVGAGRTVQLLLRGKGPWEKAPLGCPSRAAVLLAPAEFVGVAPRTVEVSFDKATVVTALPPGRFRLTLPDLGAGCYQAGTAGLDLTADLRDPFPVELGSTGAIRGVLRSGPAPPSGYAVVLTGFQSLRVAFPDAEGKFVFDGLPPGPYRIGARAKDGVSRASWFQDADSLIALEIPGGSPTDMELPAPPVREGVGR